MAETQLAYAFGCGPVTPMLAAAKTVGNKAAQLMRMADAGLPVPAGFVLTTDLCRNYFAAGQQLPEDFPGLLSPPA